MTEFAEHMKEMMTKVYMFIGSLFGAGSSIVFSDYADLAIKGAIGAFVGTLISFFTTMMLKKLFPNNTKSTDNET